MYWIVLSLTLHVSTGLLLYQNAKFTPLDDHFTFANISSINSRSICACYCFNDPMCLIATYSGLHNRCILSLARWDQGTIQIATTQQMSSVLIFNNKTLPGK